MDRPAVNFYEIGGPQFDPRNPDRFNIYNDPSWRALIDLALAESDLLPLIAPRKRPTPRNPRQQYFKTEQFEQNGSRFTRTTLSVAGRTMTALTRRDPNLATTWQLQHLLKDVDDLRAYLQLPDEVFEYDAGDVSHLIAADRALGDRGIVMVDVPDPVCEAAMLLGSENFMLIGYTQPDLIEALLNKLAPHRLRVIEQVSAAFPQHPWRIYGPEFAAEPNLPPAHFRRFVLPFTGAMVRAIQRHGGWARLHCHGRVASALPVFVEMSADATDPLEPPPQGDVQLADVRACYGRDMALFGNIEASDIETMQEDTFEKLVAQTLRDGTSGPGRGFVLMPSAAPFSRTISPRTLRNYQTMVRLAQRG